MKTRFRFTKTGSIKYIGHLDCMRFFQKALRRAKMDVAYSQGFNPHQIMSFASPLSVGLTSDGEYIDIEFVSLPSEDPTEVVRLLNEHMTEELFVTDMKILPEKTKTSMALLVACDYRIDLKKEECFWKNMTKDSGKPISEFSLKETFESFMKQPQIIITKKTKKSEKEMDIKPYILHYAFSAEEFERKTKRTLPEMNNEFDSEETLFLQLTSGSSVNIKPEHVLEAFEHYVEATFDPYSYQIHRLEMYFMDEEGESSECLKDNLP